MKKTYRLMLLAALLLGAAGQTKAAMPQVSDGTNTYWYYMKNQGDGGREARVLTKNVGGYYYGVTTWSNQSVWAKFKVIAGGAAGTYDILTEDGLYLTKGLNGTTSANNVFQATDNTNWTFTLTNDGRGTPCYRLKNDDASGNTRLQMKISGAGYALRSEYPTDEVNNLWNFIPVAELPYQVSTAGNEHWYAFTNLDTDASATKGRKGAYLGINATDNKLQASTTPQLWKIEDAGSGKYYLINKNGRYASLTKDGTTAPANSENYTSVAAADATPALCGLQLVPTCGLISDKMNLIFANDLVGGGSNLQVFHLFDLSSSNLYVKKYTSEDISSKWAVLSEAELLPKLKADLQTKFTNATALLLDKTKEGANPGQFTATARTDYSNAITSVESVLTDASADITAVFAAINTLDAATAAYKNAVIQPVVSADGVEKWYYIQGTRPANTYITTDGAGTNLNGKAVIPDNTQLWKLVAVGSGFGFVNKSTGEYINTNVASNTTLQTQAAAPTNALRFITTESYTDKTARFLVENAAGSTPAFRLHAGQPNVLNWTGDANDNCSWLFLDYAVATRVFLKEFIGNAKTLATTVPTGDDFGQYPSADHATLTSAISVAEGVDADNTATDAQLEQALADIKAAITTFKTKINKDVNSLLSATPNTYRWYWIVSKAAPAPAGTAYCAGKVISSTGRAENEKFTFEDKATTATDEQLFRFEVTGTEVAIVNKAGGKYMGDDGAIKAAATNFALNLLADGVSFNIKPASVAAIHAQNDGSHIVNWVGEVGSASAWVINFSNETSIPTGVGNMGADKYVVKAANGIITVDGVTDFEVYTVAGQKVNAKAAQKAGVYVVKVKDFTKKIVVK